MTLRSLLASTGLLLGAISPMAQADTLRLGIGEWATGQASTYVLKAVLEDAGHEVDIRSVSLAAIWQGLSVGELDAFTGAWLPVTQASYHDSVGDKVEDLGPNLSDARVGLAVPSYVEATSIADLAEAGDTFDRRIHGIDPGAGIMALTEQAMEAYGLDEWQLVAGSDAAMSKTLEAATERQDSIVVTAWAPHPVFAGQSLRYLEDPQGLYSQEESIHTITRLGLAEEKPEIAAILDRFAWSADDVQDLMEANQANGEYEANARAWVEAHPELVAEWLGKDD
ncbi:MULTISPECIES: glycine betaine ABC transporter substrate-binding protein [unclassified Halomonas]|uniref:glycine betaine ABC transporter substrate-binding protein n=1 Tax=unclassified Halomonas TaxID=2609666 RepID=UPI00288632DF|nr:MULTISPECIES: glycine betaine ABC transporter substrate-binding protein [unclassified Halomonas]MDT0499483.1 glycine betaine ABC transporter substrate-binding protein [Halomonas sp. PAR7]MDT0510700.1 glycine betaine ABC transporter substrate-binding protein [Halomonas sp. LES1]MDT0592287.1 glycine betaine ABC transporter substrate-binding protein [Halomonas sp. PAR8]